MQVTKLSCSCLPAPLRADLGALNQSQDRGNAMRVCQTAGPPLPPPCGWSTGFMAMPRVIGRLPFHLAAPALPSLTFLCCGLDSTPMVATHLASTLRCSPEGSFTTAYPSAPAPCRLHDRLPAACCIAGRQKGFNSDDLCCLKHADAGRTVQKQQQHMEQRSPRVQNVEPMCDNKG